MNRPDIIYLQDRTSIEVDWTCEMMYYWYKLYNKKGIVPLIEQPWFEVGRNIHDDLSGFAEGLSTKEVLAKLPTIESCKGDQLLLEPLCRRIGWVVAFGSVIWPYIIDRFEVIRVEGELIFDRSPLWIPVTPDLVLRNRKTRRLVYVEYKSTGSTRPGFALHWPYAIQLHLGIKAIEEEFQEEVEYGQVLGLYKGVEQKGKLRHPYVWAYYNHDSFLWSHEWKSQWDLRGVWDHPDGPAKWAKELGGLVKPEVAREVMKEQFVWSEPVFKDERVVNNLIHRRTKRGEELEWLKTVAMTDPTFVPEHYFDQRSIHCKPVIGAECPYLAACFNSSVNDDPIGSGLYVERTPHHDVELTLDTGGRE